MAERGGSTSRVRVLDSKRNASRYQILVQIADRQPAVSQQEIADALGVTAQAVSDYLGDLIEDGFVTKHGRARYEITKEGVDWLIAQTDDLRGYLDHVTTDVLGTVDIEAAIATEAVTRGTPVSLSMQDGLLHATPGTAGPATAVTTTDADAATDVGVTDFEGILDYEFGRVTILTVPMIRDGGSEHAPAELVREQANAHDLTAALGTEALAATRAAGLTPDLRFGVPGAVQEAATKGLSVFVVATTTEVGTITDRLQDQNISHEVLDPTH